jgi:glycosyltransferase involved in cell wall biosynthesis
VLDDGKVNEWLADRGNEPDPLWTTKIAGMLVAFDLSRLLLRAGRMPTGIDRVELAYAEYLIRSGIETCFTSVLPFGRLGVLPQAGAEELVHRVGSMWRGGPVTAETRRKLIRFSLWLSIKAIAAGERAFYRRLQSDKGSSIYLLASHHHLERRRLFQRIKERTSARIVCVVHDLIPIEYPEYAKPGQADVHRRRIECLALVADTLIVNSTVTRNALMPYVRATGRQPDVVLAPFAMDLPVIAPDYVRTPDRPFFVYVGTIEARKNHLLLLNVWRRLAEELGEQAPLLVLIGQRGWEAENVIDMLDRCPRLRGPVIEHAMMADREMVALLKGARALLLPSFAEGFGLPLIEALGAGVPVLSSDIPALRETGGDIPEYIDPLDGLGWRRAILDYANPLSPRRDAQLRRLGQWHVPSWEDHFARVGPLLMAASEPMTDHQEQAAERAAIIPSSRMTHIDMAQRGP